MKALRLIEKEKLILEEIDNPVLQQDEILVDIEITGIGGSEYLGFNNPGIRNLPNIMGHGICGKTKKGIRVAIKPLIGCNDCAYCKQNLVQLCSNWKMTGVHTDGGFAQQIAVSKNAIIKIPEHISWEQSCFIEPFANSINAWEIANVEPRESLLIIGAGSIGLGLVACARSHNHNLTFVLEKSKQRIKVAEEIGAKTESYTADYFDVVFDTVGSKESRNETFKFMKPNGKGIFLGFASSQQAVNFSELIRMQYKIAGSFAYAKKQFADALDLVKFTKKEWVKNLKFNEVESQLKQFLKNDFSVIKAALRPNKN